MRNPMSRIPDCTKFRSPHGSRTKQLYEAHFDGRHGTLVPNGVVDTQEQINAYAPFTDINFMLHRLKVGDTSVLARSRPIYGDFTNIPNNPVDAINLFRRAESIFDSLPVEEKQDYNNDFRVWIASVFGSSSGSSNAEPRDGSGVASDHLKEETK